MHDLELSRRERQIMDILFRRTSATVAEVMEDLPDPPTYSAVRATLRILEEKGHVTHEQDGPRYVYRPAVAAESARTAAMRHLVRTFFNGSPELAAAALLGFEDTELTPEKLEELSELVRRAREEGR